jgi:hypothetical protein
LLVLVVTTMMIRRLVGLVVLRQRLGSSLRLELERELWSVRRVG